MPKQDILDSFVTKQDPKQEASVETEHLKLMFKMIYSKDDIQLKTDLTPAQIMALTKMEAYASVFGVDIVQKIAVSFMTLAVSNKRLGRKEFTEIARSVNQAQQLEPPTLSKRLMGM